jgi:hypothetical protein
VAEFKLVVRAVMCAALLMSIIIMPIAYNAYDLDTQKQEYDAQISLLNAGYQRALVKSDILLRKNTFVDTLGSLEYALMSIMYTFVSITLEAQYQITREQDPKTYWQKVKKFWRA